MKSDRAIEAEGLTRYFDDLVAVDHIDFQVNEGEIFGFLGPNGAGKTTTIRMLTGCLPLSQGRASVGGHDVVQEPQRAKREIGVVPETSNPYKELSVWNNLLFAGELYGIPQRERKDRAEQLLEMFHLADERGRRGEELSRGMRRKLVIAMALISGPRVLFLDEPTSGLDVATARLIRKLMRKLNDGGVTIFLSTHNLEEADHLCHRVAIIDRGRIIECDRPERLKSTVMKLKTVEVSFAEKSPKIGEKMGEWEWPVTRAGDKYQILAEDPSPVLFKLLDFAKSQRLSIVALNTLRPRLEEIFIHLTQGQNTYRRDE